MAKVEVILIGGEKREISFNNYSLVFIAKAIDCDPLEVYKEVMDTLSVQPLRGLTFIIYGGLLGFLEAKAIYKHDITLPLVSQWVADANVNEFDSVWELFRQTMDIPKASAEDVAKYERMQSEQGEKKNKSRSSLKNSTSTPL